MTLRTKNPLVLLISVLAGVGIGKLLHIEDCMPALRRQEPNIGERPAARVSLVVSSAQGLARLEAFKMPNFLAALVVAPLLSGVLPAFCAVWPIGLFGSHGEVSGGRRAQGRLVRGRVG